MRINAANGIRLLEQMSVDYQFCACHNLLAVQEENPKVLTDLGLQQAIKNEATARCFLLASPTV